MSSVGPAAIAATATTECSSKALQVPLRVREYLSGVKASVASVAAANNNSTSTVNSTDQLQTPEKEQTFLYLAYGSNLSAETFRGKRNVKPLSAVNVVVPELEVVFDLPGIPYAEPAFANSRIRARGPTSEKTTSPYDPSQKSAEFAPTALGWDKGLVGTVYEVTATDYAHIIATEGGGSGYKDILVDCFTVPRGIETTPTDFSGESFKAHTLLAPRPSSRKKYVDGYAEASVRYMNLLVTGAAENGLPDDYREWLGQIKPYRVTTWRQKAGKLLVLATWGPLFLLLLQLGALMADEQGKMPRWLQLMSERIFSLVWLFYDNFYFRVFGDGERTIGDDFSPPGRLALR